MHKKLESQPFDRAAVTNAFLAAAAKEKTIYQKITPPAWPSGLAPKARPSFGSFSPGVKITTAVKVPTDVLIVLYTVQETEALLDVFTGSDSWDATMRTKWYPYAHNWSTLSPLLGGEQKSQVLGVGAFGYLFPMTVGGKNVVLFKTELHPQDDGPKVPFIPVMQQLISELAPSLVITTGTAGAIGATINCGDVVITDTAGLHCQDTYPSIPDLNTFTNNDTQIKSTGTMNVSAAKIAYVQQNYVSLSLAGLNECYAEFAGNSAYSYLKKSTSPTIYVKGQNNLPHSQPMVIVSADYLSVDDNNNSEKLQGLGCMNDTDDGFLAYAISKMPASQQPQWLSIRNASEPQIQSTPFAPGASRTAIDKGLSSQAGPIYGVYQFCTTINSALACWGVIAGMT